MNSPSAPSLPVFDVSAAVALLGHDDEGICLKIASPQVEVNVWLSQNQANALTSVSSRSHELKALCLGTSANQSVHWSRDADGRYYLLVGDDDETWDIGITLDNDTFEAIVNAVADPSR